MGAHKLQPITELVSHTQKYTHREVHDILQNTAVIFKSEIVSRTSEKKWSEDCERKMKNGDFTLNHLNVIQIFFSDIFYVYSTCSIFIFTGKD